MQIEHIRWLNCIVKNLGFALGGQVRKPGVSAVLETDLSFLYMASRVLEFLNPDLKRLSLADITQDIRASMMDEVQNYKGRLKSAEIGRDFSDCYLHRQLNLPSHACFAV
jgi:aarF domain-containing kinase